MSDATISHVYSPPRKIAAPFHHANHGGRSPSITAQFPLTVNRTATGSTSRLATAKYTGQRRPTPASRSSMIMRLAKPPTLQVVLEPFSSTVPSWATRSSGADREDRRWMRSDGRGFRNASKSHDQLILINYRVTKLV